MDPRDDPYSAQLEARPIGGWTIVNPLINRTAVFGATIAITPPEEVQEDDDECDEFDEEDDGLVYETPLPFEEQAIALEQSPPKGWTKIDFAKDIQSIYATSDEVILDDGYAFKAGLYDVVVTADLKVSINTPHPHVRDGSICWGSLHELLEVAQLSGDLAAVLAITRELLGHWNPYDSYHKPWQIWDDYPEQPERCERCGNSVNEDESYEVDGATACSDCSIYCEQCDRDRWYAETEECMAQTSGGWRCGFRICPECRRTCEQCEAALCKTHAEECACGRVLCPTCLGACHCQEEDDSDVGKAS